ncbi:unnamed protein product [Aphanomyces euteiches]
MWSLHDAATTTRWEGWIYKKGSVVPSWKKRYMVLEGREITYYDQAKREHRKEKGSFLLAGVQRSNDIAHGMTLRSEDGSHMQIYTDTVDEFVVCFNAMSKAVTMPSPVPSGNSKNQIDDTVTENDSYAGWMEKEGERVKTWKRRYFVLAGRNLRYYEKFQGEKPKGGGRIESIEYSERQCGLIFHLESNRALNVAADSDLEMKLWVSAVCKELGIKTKDIRRPVPSEKVHEEQPKHYSAIGAVLASVTHEMAPKENSGFLGLSANKPIKKSAEDALAEDEALAASIEVIHPAPEILPSTPTPESIEESDEESIPDVETSAVAAVGDERASIEEEKVERTKKKKRERTKKTKHIASPEAPRGCCTIL